MEDSEEWQKAQRGELYHAWGAEFIQARSRCAAACTRFNSSTSSSRRRQIELWREITQDTRPLPAAAPTIVEDDELLSDEPWISPPVRADYGFQIHVGAGSQLNYNATFVDTCPVSIGRRTLVGPNCSFYSGTHPLDPALRNGTAGPELGKPISIGDDCWLGGNVVVLPGVVIGTGCVIGAGSVVTKNVPAFHVAAGNPARIIRKIETKLDPASAVNQVPANDAVADGAETVIENSRVEGSGLALNPFVVDSGLDT